MIIAAIALVGALAMSGCMADSPVAPVGGHATVITSSAQQNYSLSVTGDGTVHVKISRARSEGSESLGAFMQRVFESADAIGAKRMVVDLSTLKGGDAFIAGPLVRGVMARKQLAKRGGLVVIIGGDSFAPSQNTARLLQRYVQPIMVEVVLI
jgi:hypothetical protein